jgi:hypothetical protein
MGHETAQIIHRTKVERARAAKVRNLVCIAIVGLAGFLFFKNLPKGALDKHAAADTKAADTGSKGASIPHGKEIKATPDASPALMVPKPLDIYRQPDNPRRADVRVKLNGDPRPLPRNLEESLPINRQWDNAQEVHDVLSTFNVIVPGESETSDQPADAPKAFGTLHSVDEVAAMVAYIPQAAQKDFGDTVIKLREASALMSDAMKHTGKERSDIATRARGILDEASKILATSINAFPGNNALEAANQYINTLMFDCNKLRS